MPMPLGSVFQVGLGVDIILPEKCNVSHIPMSMHTHKHALCTQTHIHTLPTH